MSNMSVARVPKTGNYTCLNNEHMFDLQLSGLAQSIMSKILALKDTWEFTMQGLYSMCQEGQKAVQKAFNQLVKAGYVVRRQIKDEQTKQWGQMMYYFYESPSLNPNFAHPEEEYEQLPLPAEETSEMACLAAWQKPLSGNASQLNTNTSNTNTVYSQSVSSDERLTDDSAKIAEEFKKPMPFEEMLRQMGSSLCQDSGPLFYNEHYESEADLSYVDPAERAVEECTIPFAFRYNQQTMENALKFLFCYSNLDEGKYKNFAGTVITCLSEVICTGMISSVKYADVYAIIQKLNEVNHDIDEDSLIGWMDGFKRHYSQKLKEKQAKGETIRNRYAYLKTCAVNYLLKDYYARDPYPEYDWE